MASEIETRRASRQRVHYQTVLFLGMSLVAQQVACSDGVPVRSRAAVSQAVDPEKEILIRDRSVIDDPKSALGHQ